MTRTRIASLRKQRGWTQEKLAEESQVNPRTIQRLESGEDASLVTLRLVANALNVQIVDLFESLDNNSDKAREIIDFDNQQAQQTKKWLAVRTFYQICLYTSFILLMLLLAAGLSAVNNNLLLDTGGILWVVLWPIGIGIIRLIQVSWLDSRLIRKYPMAENLNTAYSKNSNGASPTKQHSGLWIVGITFLLLFIIYIIWEAWSFFALKFIGF